MPDPPSRDSWHWLIDALAEELAREPQVTAEAVVASLLSRCGYELADELDPERELRLERLTLVHRLAARMARSL